MRFTARRDLSRRGKIVERQVRQRGYGGGEIRGLLLESRHVEQAEGFCQFHADELLIYCACSRVVTI